MNNAAEVKPATKATAPAAHKITYYSQIILIYIVVVACIVNLTLGTSDSARWSSLLSACLGYILPAPKLESPK